MTQRKAGWYWVKYLADSEWVPSYYNPDDHDRPWPEACSVIIGFEPHVIGQRIPTPDEPWKTVPIHPDRKMMHAGTEAKGRYCWVVYADMLAAAPKP